MSNIGSKALGEWHDGDLPGRKRGGLGATWTKRIEQCRRHPGRWLKFPYSPRGFQAGIRSAFERRGLSLDGWEYATRSIAGTRYGFMRYHPDRREDASS